MARCSREGCSRWRPDVLVERAGLGLLLDRQWFCSPECVQQEVALRLRRTRRPPAAAHGSTLRLGAVLMRQGVLTAAQTRAVGEAQRASGLRFGAQAVQLGFATASQVLEALSIQQAVPYLASIDLERVRSAPGGLASDQVSALGLVPFHQDAADLLVACVAPVPRAAVAALEVLLRTSVSPFLVGDTEYDRLVVAYGTAAVSLDAGATARDVDDGAWRVAAMAERTRAVEMTTALIEPFTWVRISADGRASTLLVPPAAHTMEGEPWLAATTRH